MALLVNTQITGTLGVTGQVTAMGISASLYGTASNATTASYALNGGSGTQTTVPSASWVSASAFITTAQTASYVLQAVSASYVLSASYSPSSGGGVTPGGSYSISASWASSSLSASYAPSTPSISASWASSSLSASYLAGTASYSLALSSSQPFYVVNQPNTSSGLISNPSIIMTGNPGVRGLVIQGKSTVNTVLNPLVDRWEE